MSRCAWVTVDVEVDLAEFDTRDLIAELQSRDHAILPDADGDHVRSVLDRIYHRRRLGNDYQRELDDLIYHVLGRIA